MRTLLFRILLPILLVPASPVLACTENAVLDLIGQLEAPTGYDTVYRGVRVPPPQPITTMTVGQVLDWQGHTVRAGSVSTAAFVTKGLALPPNGPLDYERMIQRRAYPFRTKVLLTAQSRTGQQP